MKTLLIIICVMFNEVCYAQHSIEIQHGQSSFYLRTVGASSEAGVIVYHEPLFFFLQNHDHSGIFYKRREVNGPNDSFSFYFLLGHSFLKDKIKLDPLYENIDAENIHPIPLKRVLFRFLNSENGKIYESIIGHPDSFLITNDILQASIQIPDTDVASIIQAINNHALELTAYYIYPATKYESQKITINHEFFFPEKLLTEIFGSLKTIYVTDQQLGKIFMNVDEGVNVYGYFDGIDASKVNIPTLSLNAKNHFPKVPSNQISPENISKIYRGVSDDKLKDLGRVLYKLDRDKVRTVTENFLTQIPTFNYTAKGIAYRDAKIHLVKIPFSEHTFFEKYEGFQPLESTCSYKTSDLPKQCKFVSISKAKDGEISVRKQSNLYKSSPNGSSNVRVFLSKDAIGFQNENIEYFHEFIFNPELWSISVFKMGKLIAKLTRKNVYLFDPLVNQKKIKQAFTSKPNCELSEIRYKSESKNLVIEDCEGDHEISSYY